MSENECGKDRAGSDLHEQLQVRKEMESGTQRRCSSQSPIPEQNIDYGKSDVRPHWLTPQSFQKEQRRPTLRPPSPSDRIWQPNKAFQDLLCSPADDQKWPPAYQDRRAESINASAQEDALAAARPAFKRPRSESYLPRASMKRSSFSSYFSNSEAAEKDTEKRTGSQTSFAKESVSVNPLSLYRQEPLPDSVSVEQTGQWMNVTLARSPKKAKPSLLFSPPEQVTHLTNGKDEQQSSNSAIGCKEDDHRPSRPKGGQDFPFTFVNHDIRGKVTRARETGFLLRLRLMLKEPKLQEFASWTNGGTSFRIYSVVGFTQNVLHTWFALPSWQEFHRQLRQHDFIMTHLPVVAGRLEEDEMLECSSSTFQRRSVDGSQDLLPRGLPSLHVSSDNDEGRHAHLRADERARRKSVGAFAWRERDEDRFQHLHAPRLKNARLPSPNNRTQEKEQSPNAIEAIRQLTGAAESLRHVAAHLESEVKIASSSLRESVQALQMQVAEFGEHLANVQDGRQDRFYLDGWTSRSY